MVMVPSNQQSPPGRRSQLEASQQTIRFFETLLHASSDGIVITSAAQDIVIANPAFCNLFGRRCGEMVETSLFTWLDQFDNDASLQWSKMEQQVRRERHCHDLQFSMMKTDGRYHFSVNASLMERVGTEEVGVILTIWRDVTDVHRMQQEQARLVRELEAKNDELERFTYTVSHDLKSPLITIGGFIGYLESDIAKGHSKRIASDIKRIKSAANKMRQLLDELLELSRIGRFVNPPQETPLAELVKEAVRSVSGRIATCGTKVEIAPDLPMVIVDRVRMLEMLQNLIDNAVKFSGNQPHPTVEIGSRIDKDSHTTDIPHLTKPFF